MIDLKAKPFNLTDKQIQWVEKTLLGLTLREKVGQLFCCVSAAETGEEIIERYKKIPFGGITYRADKSSKLKEITEKIQSSAKIPLLISANLETGGNGVVTDGTVFASQLEVGATGDPRYAYMLGDICGAEAACVGVNYAFAPVVDVHYNWRNPIINTRTYGSNPEKVREFAEAYIDGISKHNIAVSIKHFPGDGVDERDQHLLSSVNSFSVERWDETFGKIYSALIEKGAQTVMVGHILLPEYSRKLRPGIKDEEILPASLAPEIVTGLLREKLGFAGMVITDSASMAGLGCAMPRRDIPGAAINAGCDMFLFGRNAEEDFENLLADAASGVVPGERIDEAVTRVLALKASLGLDSAKSFTRGECESTVGCKEFFELSKECADRAITLVKDTQKLLPIKPETHRRVLMIVLGDKPAFRGGSVCKERVKRAFEKAGFAVELFGAEGLPELIGAPVSALKEKYDLILYVANVITGGNNTVNRIAWAPVACGEAPQFTRDIPTLFVSLGDPYHFVDVPMVRTIVNCYENSDATVEALVEKLTGKSEFKGVSPVDPFCGMWGANL